MFGTTGWGQPKERGGDIPCHPGRPSSERTSQLDFPRPFTLWERADPDCGSPQISCSPGLRKKHSRARDEDTRVQDRLSTAIQTIHASLLSGLHNPTPAGSPGTDSPPQTTLKPGAVSGATAPGSLEASLRLRSRPHCPPSSLLPPPGSSGQTRGAGAGPRMRLRGPWW